MSMTDPIADVLTRIRNAISASHETVEVPASKLGTQLARLLKEQGYITEYEPLPPERGVSGNRIVLTLRYTEDRQSAISGLRRLSRPGRRTYVDARHIPKVQGGMGTTTAATSRGVIAGPAARA